MPLSSAIVNDLKKMGIQKGDTLLVHSSLRALGAVPNKAQLVTNALLEVLGRDGTLLMPALSYNTVTKQHPIFDIKETASCVGGLTEYFRKRIGVQRSLHPTHSVCAIGKHADTLLKDHHLDRTPCGANSPFNKIHKLQGKILFLGCSLNANTSMHGVEELSRPPYLYGETVEYQLKTADGDLHKRSYKTHDFEGYDQCYDRVLPLLSKNDFRMGNVLQAATYLLNCRPLWEKAHAALLKNPFSFVNRI